MNYFRFVLNRAGYHWLIFFTLLLGVIFSITLLASGPLIVNTVLDLSLPHKLRSLEPLDGNLHLTANEHFNENDYYQYADNIRGKLFNYLGNYISTIINGGTTGYIYPWLDGFLLRDHRVSVAFYQDLEKNALLLEGEWPSEGIEGGKEIRVVISSNMSNDYHLLVGDRLPLSYTPNESEPSIWLRISGIISQTDPQDIYWFGDINPLRNRANGRWSSSYSVFVYENDFFELNDRYFNTARSEFYWNVILDPDKITFDQIKPLYSQLNNLRSDVKSKIPKVSVDTDITNVLDTFSSRARIVRITLYILIGEVLCLAIFYMIMISTLFSEYLSAEYSNLSSRGSSVKNILFIQLIEALFISGVALVIGVFFAMLIVRFITEVGPLSDVNQSSWNIRFPHSSLVATSLGIFICILSLLSPVRKALKNSVVTHSRDIGRVERSPFWQRFYLDILILCVGLILLWRFYFLEGMLAAQWKESIDWLILFTPLIFLIGAAALINRLFPIMVNGLSILLARGRSFTSTLALYHISRKPGNITRLVFFLMVSMALGVLTNGMNATLDANEYERALYANGSPVRLEINPLPPGINPQNFNQVEKTSQVYRSQGSLNIRAYRIIPSFELLAINPYTFIEVTKFRVDYATIPMGEVLGKLVVDIRDYEYPVFTLPEKPNTIGVWVLNDSLYYKDSEIIELLDLRGKIQTALGESFIVNLKQLTNDDKNPDVVLKDGAERRWHYFEGRIPVLNNDNYPLSLHSLWINIRSTANRYWRISLLIDDISLHYQNNDIVIVEDFENVAHIWHVDDALGDVFFTRRKPAHSGTGSLNLDLPAFQTKFGGIGLSIAGKTTKYPIPVLASQEFLSITELAIGDRFFGYVNGIRVMMVIVEGVNYFPTLYDQPGQGFLVLPLEPLLIYLNQETIKSFNVNEIWLNPDDIAMTKLAEDQAGKLINIRTIEEERSSIKADSLTLGLRSVTLISFWISVILSVLGFSSNFYINARSRDNQFGILRSLGMSIKQLYAMLFVEQLLVIIIAMTAGLLLGLVINMIILPGLPITLSEKPPIPPFLPHMNWISIITMYVLMTMSFIIFIGISALFLWKAEVHKALRIGIE
jgi:ABC-type antimicrobial peptide transport system permease subunit